MRLHMMTVMQRCVSSESRIVSSLLSVPFPVFSKTLKRNGHMRRRRWRRRRGEAEGGEGRLRREQSAGLLWSTWSSDGLRIYSSTAAVRGSGASCALLPRIRAKPGGGVPPAAWIQDSAAPRAPLSFSMHAHAVSLSLFSLRFCFHAFASRSSQSTYPP